MDEALKNNLGTRQRIKIIAQDKSCVADVPPENVEGVGCTNQLTCAPRPADFGRDFASWEGITFLAAKDETVYKVCWCAGLCYAPASWSEVPGMVTVEPSAYSWSSAVAATQETFVDGLTLKVSRPAFSSTSLLTSWAVKLVSASFDCNTFPAAELAGTDYGFNASSCEAGGLTCGLGPDEAEFKLTATALLPAGDYIVCFSETGGQTWTPIPSAKKRYLPVASTGVSFNTGVYHNQLFSARAGTMATISAAGFKMSLPNDRSIALVYGTSCIIKHKAGAPVCGAGHANGPCVIATLAAATSTDSTYAFTGTVPADAVGRYTVCMADTPSYTVNVGKYFGYATADPFNETALAAGSTYLSDLCVTKCSYGCVGADCNCEGFLSTDEGTYGTSSNGPLCLTAAGCRTACEATDGCAGYSMHNTLPRCFLAKTTKLISDTSYTAFESLGISSFSDSDHFLEVTEPYTASEAELQKQVDRNLGTLYVSQKVEVGAKYVVTPNEPTSLEVVGEGLKIASDRVMVIDCTGTCGVTRATKFVENLSIPVNAIFDRPSKPEFIIAAEPSQAEFFSYSTVPKMYCPGNLLPIEEGSLAASNRCYQKCYEGACDGRSEHPCFCDGFIEGYDTPESSALCLDQQQCEWLCSMDKGCHSVDMHTGMNRCYLNALPCEETIKADLTVPSEDYKILVKKLDMNTRRLQDQGRRMTAPIVRELLAQDPGISWDGLLRFKDVTFSAGGEYKLCFCDSDILTGIKGANALCDSHDDYMIEVGAIHATGLQCLLSNPAMARGTCTPMLYGGLRCYEGTPPDVIVPSDYSGVPNPAGVERSDLITSLITFCQYADPADTSEFSFCEKYTLEEATPAPTPAPTKKKKR